LCRAQD
ncbi:hypothetical protein BN1723_020886, partial [Verticillium longisporum]